MARIKKPRPSKRVNEKLLIICGGHTEKDYVERLKNESLFKIKIEIDKPSSSISSPTSVVNKAIGFKNKGYSRIYAIFDKDDFEDFDNAIQLAKSNGIDFIFSNQAFELWILYHFEYFTGSVKRDECIAKIINHLKNCSSIKRKKYNKSNLGNMWDTLYSKLDMAKTNSKKSCQNFEKLKQQISGYENCSAWESSSNMYLLIQLLIDSRK